LRNQNGAFGYWDGCLQVHTHVTFLFLAAECTHVTKEPPMSARGFPQPHRAGLAILERSKLLQQQTTALRCSGHCGACYRIHGAADPLIH